MDIKEQYFTSLKKFAADEYRERFRRIIQTGYVEMPLPPPEPDQSKKRGREKKTKELNLLERLRDFDNDVLRFMIETDVPFTNNRGENDIRMTKVQQNLRLRDGRLKVRLFLMTDAHRLLVAVERMALVQTPALLLLVAVVRMALVVLTPALHVCMPL